MTLTKPAVRPRARPGLVWPGLLLVGWLAQTAARWWLARDQIAPIAQPDETGYLLAARWLTGGAGGDLSSSTFYPVGYPLLLAPIHLLSDDPQLIYRLTAGLNAMVNAAVFPLGYLALRRFGLDRKSAYVLGHAVALLPAAAFFAQFALADAVLPVVVLGWLLTLHAFLLTHDRAAGTLAGLAAAYACATHSRGTVVLAVHLAIMAAALARRWVPRSRVIFSLGVVTGAHAAGALLNRMLMDAVYPGGTRDLGAIALTRLTGLDGQARALAGAAGQIWYLTVATWGLGGIGILTAGAVLIRSRIPRPFRVAAGALLAVTIGIAYGSAAALPDETRVGNYVYGRYLACVAVPFVLGAVAAWVRADRRSWMWLGGGAALMTVALGAVVDAYAGERLQTSLFIAFDFPETSFLTADWAAFQLGLATVAALALLVILALIARSPGRVALFAVALFAINTAATIAATANISRPGAAGHAARPRFPAQPYESVAVHSQVRWQATVPQRYYVWWTPIRTFDGEPPPGTCLAVVPWGETLPGWMVVASSQREGWVAFRQSATVAPSGRSPEERPTCSR